MNKFEATILISPDISNQILDKEIDSFKSQIESQNGKIINHENWGLRDLSYNIKDFKKAFYNYFQLEFDGNNMKKIQNNLNQNEKIVRHLFVKVEKHEELPTKILANEEK